MQRTRSASISPGWARAPVTPDPLPKTILAFDFGQRRIGVAVGQDVTGSASPLGIVANDDGRIDFETIGKHIADWHPQCLVVGMPLHADGTPSDMQKPVNAFIRSLDRFDVPIVTADERYTSIEAERVLKEARADGRRGRIEKADIDAAAAVLIAERYLAGAP